VSCGYASRICSAVSPLARKSRINDTQMRRTLDARLAEANVGVDHDAIER
jgi:hypothetical protein